MSKVPEAEYRGMICYLDGCAMPRISSLIVRCLDHVGEVDTCSHCKREYEVEEVAGESSAFFCDRCSGRMQIGPFPDFWKGGKPYTWSEDELGDATR